MVKHKEVVKINVVTIQGFETIAVGVDDIDKILDESLEYNNGIYALYSCYDKDGRLIKAIENCPVIVDFKIEPDTAPRLKEVRE